MVKEVAAQRRDHPDHAGRRQPRHGGIECQAIGVGKRARREDRFELVEHQDQTADPAVAGRGVRIGGGGVFERHAQRSGADRGRAAQQGSQLGLAVADRRQLRQGIGAQQRRCQPLERRRREVGGMDDDMAPGRLAAGHAWDHAGRHEIGHQPGAYQRRLAGAAGPQDQHEGLVLGGALDQRLGDLALGALAAEEDGGVLAVEGLQAAVGRARPPFDACAVARRRRAPQQLGQAPAQQLAQVLFELGLELLQGGEAVERGLEVAARVLEVGLPEILQRLPLVPDLVELVDAAEAREALALLAVDQEVGHAAALLARGQRALEFPFRAGHRRAPVDAAILACRRALGQRRAQPRPQDQHQDVGIGRRVDDVLEMARAQHRLVFPEHRRDVEERRELTLQPADHQGGATALVAYVTRRGDEYPEALRHWATGSVQGAPRAWRTISAASPFGAEPQAPTFRLAAGGWCR